VRDDGDGLLRSLEYLSMWGLNGAEEEDVDADGGCLVCDDSGSGFWKFATFIFFLFILFWLLLVSESLEMERRCDEDRRRDY
jgi:hypothetical protein